MAKLGKFFAIGMIASLLLLKADAACNCDTCTDEDSVNSSQVWSPSSRCPSNARAYVETLKVESTDGSKLRITTSADGFATYYTAASSDRDSTVTCFNMASNVRVGGEDRNIEVKIECKNTVYSCPYKHDIRFTCQELPTPRPTQRPTPSPTPAPTRADPTPAPTPPPTPTCKSEQVDSQSSCNEYCGNTSNYSWSTLNGCGYCKCNYGGAACGGCGNGGGDNGGGDNGGGDNGGGDNGGGGEDISGAMVTTAVPSALTFLMLVCLGAELVRA